MCARYEISEELHDELLERIIAAFNRAERSSSVKLRGEVFPSDTVPVILRGRTGTRALLPMQWGFTVEKKRIINARSESAHEKHLFAESFANRRCLIPGSWYYEWDRSKPAHPKCAIRPAGHTGILLAGIFRAEMGKPVFTVLTKEPEGALRSLHDRMPVLLPPEMMNDWLDPRFQARELLPHALTDVTVTPVRGTAEQLSLPLD